MQRAISVGSAKRFMGAKLARKSLLPGAAGQHLGRGAARRDRVASGPTEADCILVEYDMAVVMEVSGTVTVLDHVERITEGALAAVKSDPAVIKAYLGAED